MGFIRQVKQEQTDHNHIELCMCWKRCAMNLNDISFGKLISNLLLQKKSHTLLR